MPFWEKVDRFAEKDLFIKENVLIANQFIKQRKLTRMWTNRQYALFPYYLVYSKVPPTPSRPHIRRKRTNTSATSP